MSFSTKQLETWQSSLLLLNENFAQEGLVFNSFLKHKLCWLGICLKHFCYFGGEMHCFWKGLSLTEINLVCRSWLKRWSGNDLSGIHLRGVRKKNDPCVPQETYCRKCLHLTWAPMGDLQWVNSQCKTQAELENFYVKNVLQPGFKLPRMYWI